MEGRPRYQVLDQPLTGIDPKEKKEVKTEETK